MNSRRFGFFYAWRLLIFAQAVILLLHESRNRSNTESTGSDDSTDDQVDDEDDHPADNHCHNGLSGIKVQSFSNADEPGD